MTNIAIPVWTLLTYIQPSLIKKNDNFSKPVFMNSNGMVESAQAEEWSYKQHISFDFQLEQYNLLYSIEL